MNCQSLDFSPPLSDRRLQRAEASLGRRAVRKLLAFALYLMGVKLPAVTALLALPEGTLHSLFRSLRLRGLPALEDRRSQVSSFRPPPAQQLTPAVREAKGELLVELGAGQAAIRIPGPNRLQRRTVLLTLLASGLLTRAQAAQGLGLSEDRTAKLARKLARHDVPGLMDRRRGQQKEYRFGPQVKAELIQQFVLELAGQGDTSGRQLAASLKERCGLQLSPRSIARHLSLMGLSGIKASLAGRLAEAKKNSPGS